MSLKQCADALDDRGYSTYLKFLADIDRQALVAIALPLAPDMRSFSELDVRACSICLFIQSQDFQRHTEQMLNLLYGGSRFATEALVNATAKLDAQVSYLHPLLLLQPLKQI